VEKNETKDEPLLLSMLPFAGLALLVVLAVVWRYLPREAPPPPPEPPSEEELAAITIAKFDQMPQQPVEVSPDDFALGPEDARVTVVEFSDFECPFCRAGASAMREILANHPEDVRLVFKNFPIDTACHEGLDRQLHPLACRSAILARCVGKSSPDLFWKAHDALFGASGISEELLKSIPAELSIEKSALERCLASPEPLEKVKEDIALAKSLGVTGTPTFFVNGRRSPEYADGALSRIVEHVLGN
jgi:protein-disulfide isomerase